MSIPLINSNISSNDEHKQSEPLKRNDPTSSEIQDCLLGRPGSGKILNHQPLHIRHLRRQRTCTHASTQRPTIGIDFISQNIFLEDKTIRLQLWDTAGQERFKALIPNYIRDTSVAVIVYDVTNRNSFKSVQKWVDDVKNQRGDGVIIALLANKVDLEERDISQQEGKELA